MCMSPRCRFLRCRMAAEGRAYLPTRYRRLQGEKALSSVESAPAHLCGIRGRASALRASYPSALGHREETVPGERNVF